MELSIFGMKFDLKLLILIAIVYFVLVGHLFCGCCNYSLMETFDTIKKEVKKEVKNTIDKQQSKELLPTQKADVSNKEGFTGANTNSGQSTPFDLTSDDAVDISKWSMPTSTASEFAERRQQPLPLQDDQMTFLSNVDFKPECCPNAYSNSEGCACMTTKDWTYLKNRGGNNVPYSEY
jgi:hypothetical protein